MRKILGFLGIIATSLFSLQVHAQEKTISGVVISATDKTPLQGVTVSVAGTSKAATTDENGKFSITAGKGQKLVLSYVGYNEQSLVVGDETSLSVNLAEAKN